jgi:hypothetical protein
MCTIEESRSQYTEVLPEGNGPKRRKPVDGQSVPDPLGSPNLPGGTGSGLQETTAARLCCFWTGLQNLGRSRT